MTDVAPPTAATIQSVHANSDMPLSSLSRVFDFTLGLALLVLSLPIMVAVALAIYIEDGGSVIFVQNRVGRGRRMFCCFKFRSMNLAAETELQQLLAREPAALEEWRLTHKLRRDPRVTRVGAFIRKRSLDELPQLLNVIAGDMSLVGPRPIVEAEIVRYGHRFHHYCSVRPGLTGLWQVSGRSDASYRSRIAMDVVYARSKRTLLDIRILAATLPVVLSRRGSY